MDEKTNFLDSLEKALEPDHNDPPPTTSPQPSNEALIHKKSKPNPIINRTLVTFWGPLLEIILFCITLIISSAAIIKSAFYEKTLLLIAAMFLQMIIITIFFISLQTKLSQDKETNTTNT